MRYECTDRFFFFLNGRLEDPKKIDSERQIPPRANDHGGWSPNPIGRAEGRAHLERVDAGVLRLGVDRGFERAIVGRVLEAVLDRARLGVYRQLLVVVKRRSSYH